MGPGHRAERKLCWGAGPHALGSIAKNAIAKTLHTVFVPTSLTLQSSKYRYSPPQCQKKKKKRVSSEDVEFALLLCFLAHNTLETPYPRSPMEGHISSLVLFIALNVMTMLILITLFFFFFSNFSF